MSYDQKCDFISRFYIEIFKIQDVGGRHLES